jgi:hypothetical protein
MAEYKLRIYRKHTLVDEGADFLRLWYGERVNGAGAFGVETSGGHRWARGGLADMDRVEVWRRNRRAGIDWYRDFAGIYRDGDLEGFGPGRFTGSGFGLRGLLAARVVAWKAGTANRSRFLNRRAETIATTLAAYNAGPLALVSEGRLLDGAWADFSVAADGENGPLLDWYCAYAPLLETLGDLAQVGEGDFDVEVTGSGYAFVWRPGQLGADRRGEARFGVELGNMAAPRYRVLRQGERTAAVVGGQDEGAARAVVVRYGTDWAAGRQWELFVDAGDVETTAGLEARGDRRLEERRARVDFNFEVVQTEGLAYGRDYFLGDVVTAVNPFTREEMGLQIVERDVETTAGLEARGDRRLERVMVRCGNARL